MLGDALRTLYAALIDAEADYEAAFKDAQAPDLKAQFQKMSALHGRAHADVRTLLLENGESPTESGSLLSAVQHTLLSLTPSRDRESLSTFADGETRTLEAYDRAIEEARVSPSAIKTLQGDRDALAQAVEDMKALAP